MIKTAIISFETFSGYTGTPVPTNYKFVCFVGDVDEKKRLTELNNLGLEFIQIEIPFGEKHDRR